MAWQGGAWQGEVFLRSLMGDRILEEVYIRKKSCVRAYNRACPNCSCEMELRWDEDEPFRHWFCTGCSLGLLRTEIIKKVGGNVYVTINDSELFSFEEYLQEEIDVALKYWDKK